MSNIINCQNSNFHRHEYFVCKWKCYFKTLYFVINNHISIINTIQYNYNNIFELPVRPINQIMLYIISSVISVGQGQCIVFIKAQSLER